MDNHNIDFDFIHKLEGFSLTGYVPDPKQSQSGVTVASGFDIGQCSRDEIKAQFSPELAEKLLPYVGKTKQAAVDCLSAMPLAIDDNQANEIDSYTKSAAISRLCKAWQQASPYQDFDSLPSPCATIIASVAFQYGNLAKRTPNFWRQVTQGQWQQALANLRNFGDKYPTRRHQEADLLAAWLAQSTNAKP
ncbi:pesticin C-terminus-like muramidase [Shewanella sp. SR44-3]|uniref:pesticin C-terminus-like muramidase n=1 Tax=Shewanella sp. SR44-3 TaxID=2760936 RepID=UPI0015FB8487|nr:pesticin C-terminus-like muramidase [Shewanella sp. SR44-3]MBB1268161.1 peptidase [Shewanella sp. SR44-3]